MVMTRRCQCWPKARRSPADCGVRDDRPFGGTAPPAAIFHFSRDRRGEHPNRHLGGYCGILQADAYAGFGELYREARKPAVGRTADATSSSWLSSRKRRSQLKRCGVSMQSLILSVRSTVCRMNSDAQRARIRSLLSSLTWKTGCAMYVASYRATSRWRRRSTTC